MEEPKSHEITALKSESSQATPHIQYDEELAGRISDKFIEGYSLQAICALQGMPSYSTLLKWLKHNKSFRKLMEGAREVRALHFEDEVLTLAAKAPYLDKDMVGGSRLAFDALKWLSEVGDPSKYGKKTTIEGNPEKPLTFIINTGFPPPNEFQRQPELGSDGLIIKTIVAEVTNETVQKPVPPVEDLLPKLPAGLFERLRKQEDEVKTTEGVGSEPARVHQDKGDAPSDQTERTD